MDTIMELKHSQKWKDFEIKNLNGELKNLNCQVEALKIQKDDI